jgi:hypothetical protein
MGRAISYCYKCSTRVREEDFERGKAFVVGDRVACAACAPEMKQASPPAPPPVRGPDSSAKHSRISAATGQKQSPAPGKPPGIWIAAGVGILVFVVAGIALSGGKEKHEVAESRPPEAAPARPKVGAPPQLPEGREVDGRKALEGARGFVHQNPSDVKGQLREFDKVTWDWSGTAAAGEAKKEVELLRGKLRESIPPQLAALEGQIRAPLEREEFGAALKAIDGAKPLLDLPEWSLALSRRREAVILQLQTLLEDLKTKAADAQVRKAAAEVEKIRGRVQSWGMEFPVKDFEEALGAAVKPAPPPVERARTEEGKNYLAKWEQAVGRATSRDYAGAIAEIERAKAGLKEEESLRELAQDVEDLKRVEALSRALSGAAAKNAPGSRIALKTSDGRRVSGRVLSNDADRVELQGDPQKPTDFVEWSQAAPGSLVALAGSPKPDPLTAGIFCLLEGDAEGAKAALKGRTDAISEKYWAYAEKAISRMAKPDPAEASARELYYSAERQYRAMETRGPAIEKYRQLKTDYASTDLVKKLSARIAARSEPIKEYYFSAPDLKASGTLKLNKNGRLESGANSEGTQVLQNFAELEFYAFPGATYRCWVQMGGCCLEVLTFYVQATDLTDVNPKTRQKAAIEPGGALVSTVKPVVKGMKPTHNPKDPKTAARWEWIEVALPKYAAPGPKKLRLITDQAGYSIGPVIVSSARTRPPAEAEFKEMEAKAAEERPFVPADPDLIAHWKFDEGTGTTAADSSGNGHTATLKNGAGWTDGRIGGALLLVGDASYAAVPNSPDLDKVQEGDFTLAAWFKPENAPPGLDSANDANYAVIVKAGNHLGIHYNHTQYFRVDHWTVEKHSMIGAYELKSPPGSFYHVASVMNKAEGTLKIYVNAKFGGMINWTPGVATRNYGAETWKIGVGHPTQSTYRWGAKGAIDDVRIYRRALAAEEIQALYDAAK